MSRTPGSWWWTTSNDGAPEIPLMRNVSVDLFLKFHHGVRLCPKNVLPGSLLGRARFGDFRESSTVRGAEAKPARLLHHLPVRNRKYFKGISPIFYPHIHEKRARRIKSLTKPVVASPPVQLVLAWIVGFRWRGSLIPQTNAWQGAQTAPRAEQKIDQFDLRHL